MAKGYGGRTEPVKGALSLEQAVRRGRAGHSYRGFCYIIAAPLGCYYTSSVKRCTRKIDGMVVATFDKDGNLVDSAIALPLA